MTCKDCVCYEKCKSSKLDFADSAEPTHICHCFQNKDEFVKVVRCRDCDNSERFDNIGNYKCRFFNKNVIGIHYCSYGCKSQ